MDSYIVQNKRDSGITIKLQPDERIPGMLRAIDKIEATVHVLHKRIESLEANEEWDNYSDEW